MDILGPIHIIVCLLIWWLIKVVKNCHSIVPPPLLVGMQVVTCVRLCLPSFSSHPVPILAFLRKMIMTWFFNAVTLLQVSR